MGQSVIAKDTADEYQATWDVIIHNRINLAYYASNNFTAHLQFRNQFLWGESVELTPDYANTFEKDKGWVDMNFNWFENDNNLLNTQVDRAFVEYVNGNLELSIGRQRVNWGRTLVWNPNDIFNAFSYYDFDYMERPGSDAVRARYYLGIASATEIVAKIDSAENLTLAGMWKTNKWSYDFQLIGGYVNGEDYVIGAGWEGNIKSFAFRGEFSYYHPEKSFADTSGVLLAAVGTDISFGNSMVVQAEFLYNDKKTLSASVGDFYSAPSNSKSLSISEFNFFANITYPITPILSIYTAAMYYPDYKGYFLMPGLDLSLSDNMNLSLIYQYFNLEMFDPLKQEDARVGVNMAFARLKWNF
ncbi:MAG: hypothetical protein PF517_02935 [Salinivirgaceae bacterium]|nr:hypothetical protein [Salinivirgaceae bacterium]